MQVSSIYWSENKKKKREKTEKKRKREETKQDVAYNKCIERRYYVGI